MNFFYTRVGTQNFFFARVMSYIVFVVLGKMIRKIFLKLKVRVEEGLQHSYFPLSWSSFKVLNPLPRQESKCFSFEVQVLRELQNPSAKFCWGGSSLFCPLWLQFCRVGWSYRMASCSSLSLCPYSIYCRPSLRRRPILCSVGSSSLVGKGWNLIVVTFCLCLLFCLVVHCCLVECYMLDYGKWALEWWFVFIFI